MAIADSVKASFTTFRVGKEAFTDFMQTKEGADAPRPTSPSRSAQVATRDHLGQSLSCTVDVKWYYYTEPCYGAGMIIPTLDVRFP
ncbi:hypothetical protein [Amycolatopsis oliviviridis]|uniref:hypothetical protein n=1 Tax=Amycolatopsis oliviviridis TaxID=1471590 RepID=UPI00174EB527|nr:hypothetical protein [Amycolatopsis oliviviridis]